MLRNTQVLEDEAEGEPADGAVSSEAKAKTRAMKMAKEITELKRKVSW